jgi:hypothetical protein
MDRRNRIYRTDHGFAQDRLLEFYDAFQEFCMKQKFTLRNTYRQYISNVFGECFKTLLVEAMLVKVKKPNDLHISTLTGGTVSI